jgi:hypothetical protein
LDNATALLRGLIYQTLVQQPSLTLHVRRQYDKAGNAEMVFIRTKQLHTSLDDAAMENADVLTLAGDSHEIQDVFDDRSGMPVIWSRDSIISSK